MAAAATSRSSGPPAAEEWRRRKRTSWGAFRGADRYESRIGGYAQDVDREVVGELLSGCDGLLLDLPCGAGRMSRLLAERNPQLLVSADYSAGMLAAARGSLDNPLVRADAFALPFPDATFDGVLCLRLLFHYADPEPIVGEMARVLRPGGRLVFDTLNPYSLRHLAERLLGLLGRRDPGRGLSFLSRARAGEMLSRHGLSVVASESRFLLPTRAYRLVPRPLHRAVGRCERVVPRRVRVLGYWRAEKRS